MKRIAAVPVGSAAARDPFVNLRIDRRAAAGLRPNRAPCATPQCVAHTQSCQRQNILPMPCHAGSDITSLQWAGVMRPPPACNFFAAESRFFRAPVAPGRRQVWRFSFRTQAPPGQWRTKRNTLQTSAFTLWASGFICWASDLTIFRDDFSAAGWTAVSDWVRQRRPARRNRCQSRSTKPRA